MESLRDLLANALHRHHISDHYTANEILNTCKKSIAKHAPEELQSVLVPHSYKHGVIFLSAQTHAAAQEFKFYEEKVLRDIQQKHPDQNIRRFSYTLTSGRP